jgi:hypothetical protein
VDAVLAPPASGTALLDALVATGAVRCAGFLVLGRDGVVAVSPGGEPPVGLAARAVAGGLVAASTAGLAGVVARRRAAADQPAPFLHDQSGAAS